MANEKSPIPGSRGERVDMIRQALGVDRQGFAVLVGAKAAELGVASGGKWTQTRVSKLILSRQPISLDDAAAVVALDPQHRGWDWFVFGKEAATKTTTRVVVEDEPSDPVVIPSRTMDPRSRQVANDRRGKRGRAR